MIKRNYRLGQLLISKSEWGNKFIDNLAQDIKTEFPETTGFSVRNLKYMKKFAKLFLEDEIDENNFAAITWYHHIALKLYAGVTNEKGVEFIELPEF